MAWEALGARGKPVQWVCWDGGGAGTGARCGGARRWPWRWQLCARRAQVGGSRPTFYRRARESGEGRWSWAWHNGGRHGRDKAAAKAQHHWRVMARPSGIDGRVVRASGMGGLGAGRRLGCGPVGALPFGAPCRQVSPAWWPAGAAPRQDRTGEG
jgi:hypothetical protein